MQVAAKPLVMRRLALYSQHVRQAQRNAHGGTAAARADVVHVRGVPGRAQLLRRDAGVCHGFVVRLQHEVLGAAVPALAKARTAHAQNGDLVADTSGQNNLLIRTSNESEWLSRNNAGSPVWRPFP